jgi:hypothetical protein
LYAYRKDLPVTNTLDQINAGSETGQQTSGNETEHALRSGFARLNYVYNDRYLFEANVRYDGSSRFPKNNRFGAFPSFSLGWRISEEDFFKAIHKNKEVYAALKGQELIEINDGKVDVTKLSEAIRERSGADYTVNRNHKEKN